MAGAGLPVNRARRDSPRKLGSVDRRPTRILFADPDVDVDTDVGEPEAPRQCLRDPVGDQTRLTLPRSLEVGGDEVRAGHGVRQHRLVCCVGRTVEHPEGCVDVPLAVFPEKVARTGGLASNLLQELALVVGETGMGVRQLVDRPSTRHSRDARHAAFRGGTAGQRIGCASREADHRETFETAIVGQSGNDRGNPQQGGSLSRCRAPVSGSIEGDHAKSRRVGRAGSGKNKREPGVARRQEHQRRSARVTPFTPGDRPTAVQGHVSLERRPSRRMPCPSGEVERPERGVDRVQLVGGEGEPLERRDVLLELGDRAGAHEGRRDALVA